MVACPDSHLDRGLLKEIGSPEIITSSLNPMKFIESLEWLIRRWKTGQLPKLLEAKQQLIEKQGSEAIKLLTKLINMKELLPIIAPQSRPIYSTSE